MAERTPAFAPFLIIGILQQAVTCNVCEGTSGDRL